MSFTEEADYTIGKNGVEYEELVKLNRMQDKVDRLLTKRECKMLMAIYDIAFKRITKEIEKTSNCISSHNEIKTAFGICGWKHCHEKGSKPATIGSSLLKKEKHFLLCSKHAEEVDRGQHVD